MQIIYDAVIIFSAEAVVVVVPVVVVTTTTLPQTPTNSNNNNDHQVNGSLHRRLRRTRFHYDEIFVCQISPWSDVGST